LIPAAGVAIVAVIVPLPPKQLTGVVASDKLLTIVAASRLTVILYNL
jgi:hypothetical protein